jgi:hypothetical protein
MNILRIDFGLFGMDYSTVAEFQGLIDGLKNQVNAALLDSNGLGDD